MVFGFSDNYCAATNGYIMLADCKLPRKFARVASIHRSAIQSSTHYRLSSGITTLKPEKRYNSFTSGNTPSRAADLQSRGVSPEHPPRKTRFNPLTGPEGSLRG